MRSLVLVPMHYFLLQADSLPKFRFLRVLVGLDPLLSVRETLMSNISKAGTFRLGHRDVKRMGYGAMQLAGPGVYGPPQDREEAIAVLREAIANGVDHIDTSDYYGPYITNEIIREA